MDQNAAESLATAAEPLHLVTPLPEAVIAPVPEKKARAKTAKKAAPEKKARAKKPAAEPVTVPVVDTAPPRPPESEGPTALQMVEMVWAASRLAKFLGLIWGGLVPFLTFVFVHFDYDPAAGLMQRSTVLAAGGLLYSAKKVFGFTRKMFKGDGFAATGFVVLVEGGMTFTSLFWASLLCLGILVATNWIATTHGLITAGPAKGKR